MEGNRERKENLLMKDRGDWKNEECRTKSMEENGGNIERSGIEKKVGNRRKMGPRDDEQIVNTVQLLFPINQ